MAVKTVKRSFTTKVTFSTQSGLTPITLSGADAENFYSAWMNGHYERPFVFEKTTSAKTDEVTSEVTTTVSVKLQDVVMVEKSATTATEDQTLGKCKDPDKE